MQHRGSRWLRFLLGLTFGIIVSLLTLFVAGPAVPAQVPSETASNFFFAASGINATLLVATAVTISAALRRYPGTSRRAIMTLFMAQLAVVFVGMVAAGIGILIFNPTATFDSSLFRSLVNLVLSTWVIGFVLLVAGIWSTAFIEDEAHTVE
ncbi:MAG: hypothetical protein ACXVIP_03380 [Halobacteriota archaeon]